MTQLFTDILDDALEAVKTESVTAVLLCYPDHAQNLAPLLAVAEKLGEWQPLSAELAEIDIQYAPDPSWQTADRAAFLAQIEALSVTAVSPNPLLRLKRWLWQSRPAQHKQQVQKEHKPMNALLARAVATAAVIFGLGGGTIALAHDSLPDTPLYPIKMMVEETRLALADNPAEQANLQLTLAQVRLQEMTQLMQEGEQVDVPLTERLETHLQQALQQVTQLGDPEMIGLLTRMQTMLQNEQQTMAQLGDPTQTMFGHVNQIMNQYQEQVQAGLDDPSMFRWRHSQDPEWEPAGQGQPNGPGNQGNQGNPGPNIGNGAGNPDNSGNGQNGPGDGTCDGDCVPVGDQNQYGQDDANSGQNGSGDGTCDGDCVPVGDQNQYGQDDANSGQNGSGDGTGICTNDCDPIGDGPQPNHENGNGHDNGNSHGNGG